MCAQNEFEKARFRKHNLVVEPFVYRPCKTLPGMIAIPVSELKEAQKLKEENE